MKKLYLLLLVVVLAYAPACKKSDAGGGSNQTDTTHPVNPVSETGLLTWSPAFPTDTGSVTITLDATKGNAGLKGYGGDVYIYTGVVTDQSNGGWKYVTSPSFNSPDSKAKATRSQTSADTYQFTLKPRTFYNVPAGEKILKLAVLFRSGDGSKVARNADNSDMFITVYDVSKLQVRFTAPEFAPKFTPEPVIQATMTGDEISVSAVASQSASLTLSLNGGSFATAANTTTVSGKTKITTGGPQTVKVTAVANGQTSEATYTFVSGSVETAALPAGAKDGVTFINNGTSAIFNLYAPDKKFAYVVGNFNNWTADPKYLMKRTPDGTRWWVQVDNFDASKYYTYQYLLDGNLKVADPYCELILDPDNDKDINAATFPNMPAYPTGATGIVSVMQANPQQYNWQVNNFTRPDKKDLVIYELHVRDFIGAHNYQTLQDTLSYLTRLGVNAIELMPVTEFEGNSSWGYNPDFYFAADKYYGPKTALQSFIDECHKRGIAVVLDMVLNHSFGQSPMVQLYFNSTTQKPASNSPWFNVDATHPYNVGYDFNHESAATKYFVKNVMQFWMQQYKVDGFRFDLSKGFTQKNSGNDEALWSQYDASRIAIWKDYNNYIKSIDPNFYVILEHFAADQEEQELSNEGMILWNNLNGSFNQATMGYKDGWDFSRIFYDKHGFTKPYNLVTYMESHDEERLQYKNEQYGNDSAGYSIKDLATGLKRQQMAAAFLFASPGPKMIWEFGEVGYDVSINDGGRTGEKPPHWEYQGNPDRQALYNVFAKMIRLKTQNAVFATTNFQYDVIGYVKYIKLVGADASVVVVGNFGVGTQPASISFPSSGTWYDCLTGETISLSGTSYSASLAPGEFHVYSSKVLNQ